MFDRRKSDKDKELALRTAEAQLKKCAANLKLIQDKYQELNARLIELDELLKK